MRLIIKPDDKSLHLILEAAQYERIWKQYSRRIVKAFREVTGLKFQQYVITVRVSNTFSSSAGLFGKPMVLSADFRSVEFKLITIIHELSHRLLGGNALAPKYLGVYNEEKDSDDTFQEIEHSNIYLFEYDVVYLALGEDWATICSNFEQRNRSLMYPHTRAWDWAMNLPYSDRQTKLKQLAAKAYPRERWHEISL